jgi:hypothetical protein
MLEVQTEGDTESQEDVMSYAATHKQHHVHIPWMPIIAVAVAVAAAAAVLILVNQPSTQTTTAQSEVAPLAVSADAAAVPAPESPALRRQIATELNTRVAQSEQFSYPRNHVVGATAGTFAGVSPVVAGGHLASQVAPNDPHPFNHFPGQP